MYPSQEPIELINIANSRSKKKAVHPGSEKLQYYTDQIRMTVKSACCKDKSDCITVAARPLLIAIQVLTILPLTFRKNNCRFTHCWLSFPAILNIVVTFVIIGTSGVVFAMSTDIISRFRGTDFYTLTLVMVSQFGATIVVYATGNFCAPAFCKGWQALHDVDDELGLTNYSVIKNYLLFVPIALIMEGSFNSIIVSAHASHREAILPIPPYVAFLASLLTNFIPNFLTFSFAVILWISGYLFECLNQSISDCLEQPSRDFLSTSTIGIGIYPQEQSCKLAKLRRTHEDLCDAVRLLESAFGFQLLVIFPATALRFIAGIYAVLTELMGVVPTTMRGFITIQGVASIIAGFRIMLVILSSDTVMKKASGAVGALKRGRCPNNSDELNQEIDVFLSKMGSFPLEIKCCSIITLNLSFLSTAIPNVITYVLVLMQFKQSDENSTCGFLENSTNHPTVLSN